MIQRIQVYGRFGAVHLQLFEFPILCENKLISNVRQPLHFTAEASSLWDWHGS